MSCRRAYLAQTARRINTVVVQRLVIVCTYVGAGRRVRGSKRLCSVVVLHGASLNGGSRAELRAVAGAHHHCGSRYGVSETLFPTRRFLGAFWA